MPKNEDKAKNKAVSKTTKKGKTSSGAAKKSTEKQKTRKKSAGSIADVIGKEHKKARKLKISRKKIKRDELQESSAKIVEYLTAHSNSVLITAGAIVSLVLILVLFNFYKTSKREGASELFSSARNLYDLALSETPPSNITLDRSLDLFETLIFSYKGEAEAALAHFYKGSIYFNLNYYDKSIEAYNKFLSSAVKNETYNAIAKTNIAYNYKNLNENEKAISLFHEISDSSEGFIKESSLFDLGLTYEQVNKNDEAIRVYTDFIENYPASRLIDKVQERLNSIQAK
jgi:tetratricopeptide (TPR) repeat protein